MIEAAAVTANETFTFWQHLANANMIEGSYTGSPAHTTYSSMVTVIGTNAPESKLVKVGWWPFWQGEYTVSSNQFVEGLYNNAFWYGAEVANSTLQGATLTPEETWNLDTKMDDGMPGDGRMIIREDQLTCFLLGNGDAGSVSTTAARADITYNFSNKSKACSLIFRDVF